MAREYKYAENRFSLKKNVLLKWMYKNGYSKGYIASRLNLQKDEFIWRLQMWEPFDEYQISTLVKIMGAKPAFSAIYFHTGKQRKEIYLQVFGEELKTRKRRNGKVEEYERKK